MGDVNKQGIFRVQIWAEREIVLLDKCQTKSFEDMNILIKAILKFCTTNQLFKYNFL